ncbi:MAG: prolyl oligopeptidase family serine peptidase [Acidimicrobiia bacterium]
MTTARRDDVVDDHHGTLVPDPYRWLEDGDDPEVRQWVAAQNARTRTVLDAHPSRAAWLERITAAMGEPVVLGAQVRGERVVLLERDRGAQQARLCARWLDDPTEPVVIADPGAATDDAAAAVDWFFTSPDGDRVAYGVSEGGTENSVLRIARTGDGDHLVDEIPNCRACSLAWDADGSGFHYTRYPEGDEYHRTVHHHTIGADWRDDPVVWAEHPNPQAWPQVEASPDGRFLLVSVMVGWGRYDVHLLDRPSAAWQTLIAETEAVTGFVFADDTTLLGMTTLDASRGRIVRVDAANPPADPSGWTTVTPERDVVVGVPRPVPGGHYVVATRAGVDRIEWWPDADADTDSDDAPTLVAGLDVVAVAGLAGDRSTGTVLALVTGFDQPTGLHRLEPDPASGRPTAVPWFPLDLGDRPSLAVRQVEYPSTDGTTIGLFLVHRHDVELTPDTPAILNGYGGFAITETPVWSPTIAAWCEAGGLYAIAGLRGGAEHGEEWHHAGRHANKQQVFDDFHAAADWLVAEGMTSRERLAIAGGSNGGLLVGAALTQRPDLCRAVWCAVPLLDMIRFPRFLIARLWTDEYGDPAVAEEFEWLWAYSPYHHVRDGQRYPAVLLTTAEGDTRVDPLHARKMAALLQHAAADQDDRPILLHQEGRAGHGVGKPVAKRAAEQADALTFFAWQLGITP